MKYNGWARRQVNKCVAAAVPGPESGIRHGCKRYPAFLTVRM